MKRDGRARWWLRGIPAVAVVYVAGALGSCSRHRVPLLTPADALRVIEADRQLNDRANATLDVGLQDRHETGAAAQIDDDSFRRLRDAGKAAIPEAFQVSQSRAFVPLQYGYPAEFLGMWTETQAAAHGTALGLFVKPTPADPWRISLYIYAPSDSPNPLPEPAVDKDGFAHRLSSGELEKLSATSESVARDVAAYWNGYPDPNAALSPTLAGGGWTTERNETTRQDVARKAVQHEVERFSTSAGPYRYQSVYRARTGDALLFLSLVERITVSVTPPLSFVSPLDYRGQQVLPLAVTKGALEMFTEVLYTVAAVVPPGGRPTRLIDGYWGPIAAARVR